MYMYNSSLSYVLSSWLLCEIMEVAGMYDFLLRNLLVIGVKAVNPHKGVIYRVLPKNKFLGIVVFLVFYEFTIVTFTQNTIFILFRIKFS